MSAGAPKSPLATASGLVCFVLVVGGLSGLAHEVFGWIRFLGFVRFLVPDGYEVVGYIAMVVLGLVIGAAGESVGRRHATERDGRWIRRACQW